MNGLPAGKDVGEFVELRFKPGSWEKSGIPEEGCRMRKSALERLLKDQGEYHVGDLILGLMDWLDVTDEPEPALPILRALLDRHYPSDGRKSARCRFVEEQGIDRVFHAGTVDPTQSLVAWQRRDWVIAAAQPSRESGRMVVGAPGPVSLSTALRILSLSMTRHMDEPFKSFEGAMTSCGSTAAFYRWEAGDVTPIRWDEGLNGTSTANDPRRPLCSADWLPPNQLAMQVAIAAGYLR